VLSSMYSTLWGDWQRLAFLHYGPCVIKMDFAMMSLFMKSFPRF